MTKPFWHFMCPCIKINPFISLARNPILAKLFRMVKLAENARFGFDKIDENWKAYNSTVPDYQIEFDSVIVDFKMETEESAGKNIGENVGENSKHDERQ